MKTASPSCRQLGFLALLSTAAFVGAQTVPLAPSVSDPDDPDVVLLDRFEIVDSRAGPLRSANFASATNVDVPLIETPATVNVISGDFIEAIGAQRLDDILQYVPGTSPGSSGASMTNTFTIRGFESSTTRGGSLGSRANSVFIDDHRPAARHYHFDRSLYERVLILKGTSSLLYGTASPGGIVRYITKKPLFKARHELGVTIASFDTFRATLDTTGPLGDAAVLAYRLNATFQEANQSFTGRNHPSSITHRYIVKPQLTWQSPAGSRLDLAYEYSEQNNVADPGIIRFSDGTYGFNGPSFVGEASFSDQTNHIVTAAWDHPLGSRARLKLSGNYGTSDSATLWDTANTRTSPTRTTLIDRDIIRANTGFDHREVRAEIHATLEQGPRLSHRATFGLARRDESYATSRAQRSLRRSINPVNPVFALTPEPGPLNPTVSWNIDEWALYAQNYATLGTKLKVFGGVRYTDAATDFNNNGGRDTSLDHSLGLIYNQAPAFNPFLSYSTSLTPQVGVLSSGGPVPFSAGEQWEVGIKSEWWGGGLSSALSLFQLEQTNRVESDPNDRTLSIITGDQAVRGLELELVGQFGPHLSLVAGYSYLDAEFSTSAQFQGNTPANVPEHKFSGMLNYSFSQGEFRWNLGLGYLHVIDRQGDNANTHLLPDYNRWDVSVGLQRGHVRFRLGLENLLDRDYVAGGGGVFVNQGRPLTYNFNVRYNF